MGNEYVVRVNHGEKPINRIYSNLLIIFVVLLVILLIFICVRIYRSDFVFQEDVYVCHHMAHDLEEQFESYGFDVLVCRGDSLKSGMGHAWIAFNLSGFLLHVDSIGCNPFVPSWYYDDISVFESYSDYLVFKNN